MSNTFIDYDLLAKFSCEDFLKIKPYPHFNFHRVIREEKFQALKKTFPKVELFEKHVGLARPGNQRPHDRLYLAYGDTIYKQVKRDGPKTGVATPSDISQDWVNFIEELKNEPRYQRFLFGTMDRAKVSTRFAWHLGFSSSEVSPHIDAMEKLGSHLFYFNTDDDWKAEWGGQTVVLGGQKVDRQNPEFEEFATQNQSNILNNHSFLFKNTPTAWHGVRALTCPQGYYRQLFTVVIEVPNARRKSLPSRIYNRLFRSSGKSAPQEY